MSDTMLFGVLRMPFEMAMGDEISRLQYWHRGQEAAARIEHLEAELMERDAIWLPAKDAEFEEAAARIERLEAALREIMGMDEVAVVDFKKGDGWLHQRVASAALENKP